MGGSGRRMPPRGAFSIEPKQRSKGAGNGQQGQKAAALKRFYEAAFRVSYVGELMEKINCNETMDGCAIATLGQIISKGMDEALAALDECDLD